MVMYVVIDLLSVTYCYLILFVTVVATRTSLHTLTPGLRQKYKKQILADTHLSVLQRGPAGLEQLVA